MATVALVIVNYRTGEDTRQCVESALRLQVRHGWRLRIIVVDNASPDRSWEELTEWADQRQGWSRTPTRGPASVNEAVCYVGDASGSIVSLLRAEENRGYAAGANIGVVSARLDPDVRYVWILNSDTILNPHSLEALLECAERQGVGIYGSTLVYHDDPRVVQAAGGAQYLPFLGRSRHIGKRRHLAELAEEEPRFDYIVGASLFCPVEVFDRIGVMPEEFFLYFEETEWCCRAHDAGIPLVWVRESLVIHKEGRSTGAGDRFRRLSPLAFRYVVRNSLLFTEARYPAFMPTVILFNCFECVRDWLHGDREKPATFVSAVQEYFALRNSWRERAKQVQIAEARG